jgi:hypothetical protein
MMPEEPINKVTAIGSPMVGFFHSRDVPDAPPFVTVGSTVRPDTKICFIEAMKVFNEIPAGVSGTITEVLIEDGQSVEYGQALFHIETDDWELISNIPDVDVFEGVVVLDMESRARDQIRRLIGG